MKISTLKTVSPIDGRYWSKVDKLADYFSEGALIKYRVLVEIEYFIELCKLGLDKLSTFDRKKINKLRDIYLSFSEKDAKKIKNYEAQTNHDVKAVEYFIKEKFKELGLEKHQEFIHFGLTSQDINNTAIPLSIRAAFEEVYLYDLNQLIECLESLADETRSTVMLARTHGQPASPTRLGKEIQVFITRLSNQLNLLLEIPHAAKFSGSTGNFNAHQLAYPTIDWEDFGRKFVEDNLGLVYSLPTTQIEHYDSFATLSDSLKRINTILLDFCRDVWGYISLDYFKLKIIRQEVGSSAMPHKVNPIDFENAEGNLEMANSIFAFFSRKLPISRFQRDLTDSTVLRNVGVPFAHTIIALKSMINGIQKLDVNKVQINHDLDKNWQIISEAIQTLLRKEGYDQPYEQLKAFTRGSESINQKTIHEFIDSLEVSNELRSNLKKITPFNYTGVSSF
ncbi:MAG: adenylosuccinate lyase [Flavobacteriaceae bacterium]|nr:adenylosuccinate lyase [Flavobacteriaceae bacterium]MCY4268493.1 adenylosuccinate lyase [Flavobacteriaceae bacterium]MCY4299007.1 adenylosuccinate lyase [Flavobacteriaceae bacterium]